jgi:tRNA (cytidine/uridine-2'-O-)-methyltransferase
MFNIILFEPEIPPNTGNIIRLCTNMGATLHLIHPLGFSLDEKQVRRAGLDYIDWEKVIHHQNYEEMLVAINPARLFAVSTKGKTTYSDSEFKANDSFIFGPETRGLPKNVLESFSKEKILRIPMQKDSRSINLSNACAIVLYEAWRQINYKF